MFDILRWKISLKILVKISNLPIAELVALPEMSTEILQNKFIICYKMLLWHVYWQNTNIVEPTSVQTMQYLAVQRMLCHYSILGRGYGVFPIKGI